MIESARLQFGTNNVSNVELAGHAAIVAPRVARVVCGMCRKRYGFGRSMNHSVNSEQRPWASKRRR
jgi:hypothetical protein